MHKLEDVVGNIAYNLVEFVGKFYFFGDGGSLEEFGGLWIVGVD